MGATAHALAVYAGWYAVLTLVMASYRLPFAAGGKALNSFKVDGSDLDPLGHRLTRARDNHYETMALFAMLALAAQISGHLEITDGLAMWVVYLRIGQALVHIASTAVPAVLVRATLFTGQLLIFIDWAYQLMKV